MGYSDDVSNSKAYSDNEDVLKAKASPEVKHNNSKLPRKDQKARRKGKQIGRKGGRAMSVTKLNAINAAEHEAAEQEAMQKRERLLIRAMIGGFLLLVLGLARQHNPDDNPNGLNNQGDPSLRGSPSLEWQGDRPNMAQHLTLETENSEDFHTKSILDSTEEDEKYDQYMDLVDNNENSNSTVSDNSQDAGEAEPETLDEQPNYSESNAEDVSTESEDVTIESQDTVVEERPSGDERYKVDPIEGRLQTVEGDGGN
ncbi:unnamed protein product [Cylindrotheca closterium]|uniref:Uncharacterized protein n=1 Tax=Cylindrotheca closterium TaxID=2856 RepID=A0AAD2FID6_9STRA|nr:unnamed protein product [Cylindrotheca closterium]